MIRRPPRPTRTDTLFPDTTLSLSGCEHHERVFDAPVGRIGNMRYARQPVELDIVLGGDAREPARRVLAQIGYLAELAAKSIPGRSEERRVGKECVSTCRNRWST